MNRGSTRRAQSTGLAMLAGLALTAAAGAQERAKIEVVPLIGHTNTITSASFSPDGARVVTASEDGTLKLWDSTARLVRTFRGHLDRVDAVAFSPDGSEVLSAARDKTARLWDAVSGREIRTIEIGTRLPVSSVAFSPDGARLLVTDPENGAAKLWDASTGRLVQTFQHGTGSGRMRQTAAAFSADGARVVTGGPGDKVAKLWDVASGRLVNSFGSAHNDRVALALSHDGARLVVGRASSGGQSSLELWDVASGKLMRDLQEIPTGIKFVAFSSEGAPVVGGDRQKAWDFETGRLIPQTQGVEASFSGLAVSPDGVRTIFTSREKVLIWDATKGRAIQSASVPRPSLNSVAVSRDGSRVLVGDVVWPTSQMRFEIRQWEAASGRLVSVRSLGVGDKGIPDAFTPDGAGMFSIHSEDLSLWEAETAIHIRDFAGAGFKAAGSPLAAFSEDRSLLAQTSGKTMKLWDVATGRTIRTFEGNLDDPNELSSVAFSADGRLIASGDRHETVRIWDAATGRLAHKLEPGEGWWSMVIGWRHYPIKSLAFSPDGARIVSCRDLSTDDGDSLKLWEVPTGRLVRTFGRNRKIDLTVLGSCSVRFSPDGTRVLSVDTVFPTEVRSTTFRLWDPATGGLIRTFYGPAGKVGAGNRGGVGSAAFSGDGRLLFTTGPDETVEIRDAHTGEPVATVLAVDAERRVTGTHSSPGDEWLAITPEGFFDASSEALAGAALSVVRGLQVLGVDATTYQVLHRPDLVRAKLAGDPDGKVKAAATELDAKLR